MAYFNRLTERHKQPEIMDDPALPAAPHHHALRSLALINRLSRSDAIFWPAIKQLAMQTARPLRVLDIASGGGDVLIRLHQRAQRAGLPFDFLGVDVSATAIEHARQKAEAAGAAVTFSTLDVLHAALPGDYDVALSSLFLHHLETDDAITLLRRMSDATRGLVLVNDLIRSPTGYWLAWFGARVLSRSPVVHVDGPRSVEGAFTMAEALAMAENAGLHGATIAWRWPCRFLLTWRRPG